MASYYRDPAIRKAVDVKAEAEKLGVPDSIISGLQKIIDLHQDRENYCDTNTSAPSDAVSTLVKDTKEHPWDDLFKEGKTKWNIKPGMMSGNLEGYVLKFLVSASKAKRVLEIGMLTGCAALNMAEVMPEDGKVVTLEYDPYLGELARKFFDRSPHGKKIEICLGNALDTMQNLSQKGEKFDFIFIDADKPGYCDYFKLCMSDLLGPGGTIAVDNTLFGGRPYMKPLEPNCGIRSFNELICSRDDIYHVLMPVRDGIMLIRRKEDMQGS